METIEIEQQVLESLTRESENLSRKETNWRNAKAYALPVLEKISALGSDSPHMMYDDALAVSLTGDVDKLVLAIRALRTGGYKSTSKPERKASQFNAFFAHSTSNVRIFFMFSSSVCRRVKVGTKTETVDVYEIQCGESEAFRAEPDKF